MSPLECLIIPQLAMLQEYMERLGYPDDLAKAIAGLEISDASREFYAIDEFNLEQLTHLPDRWGIVDTLQTVFMWDCTPQGLTFWTRRCDELSDLVSSATDETP